MSASNKKKLRKEQNAALLTEKQKREQQEARKLKAYTWTFAIIMILVVAIVVGVVVTPLIDGMIRRGSQAVTIGDHKLSAADFTYFYYDAVSEYQQEVYSQYYNSLGNYWSVMLGFDTTKPLNEQAYDNDKTWADHFVEMAVEDAKDVYALYDDAIANNYKLSDDEQKNMDSYAESLDLYATYYGYSNAKSWLRNTYGNGATQDSYLEYYKVCATASAYLNDYSDKLEYKPEDYRAYEKDKFDDYSTVSYVHYTLNYTAYLGEGTKGEDGKTTWTDEQHEAARKALQADIEILKAAEITDKESFDKAIQGLPVNKIDKDSDNKKLPTSTEVKHAFFENISLNTSVVDWLKETTTVDGQIKTARTAGELKAFEVYTYEDHEDDEHEHGDDCGCKRTVDAYTVVLFNERCDHTAKMANVRHILVKFEGGKTDENKNTTYSDEEKAKAKAEAEKLLQEWLDGKATEESFGELANSKSDDQNGKVTNGGLYEDIYQGQMVEAFEDWCFAEGRKAGDTGIVETEYGYHVMYYSSTDEMSYRDTMIESDMRNDDTDKWRDGLVEKVSHKIVSLNYVDLDYIVEKG